jgi:hypothetical protein
MGLLYVDGHVRAYHGKREITSKAYVARRHLPMPASTDYWINDLSGDPVLVITGEMDAALAKVFPRLLEEVRHLVGEQRVIIVFDRGGWSPKLFATMIKSGFDVLTYRKGRCRRINEQRFTRRIAEFDGCRVDYVLHDQPVRFLGAESCRTPVSRRSRAGSVRAARAVRSCLADADSPAGAWRTGVAGSRHKPQDDRRDDRVSWLALRQRHHIPTGSPRAGNLAQCRFQLVAGERLVQGAIANARP